MHSLLRSWVMLRIRRFGFGRAAVASVAALLFAQGIAAAATGQPGRPVPSAMQRAGGGVIGQLKHIVMIGSTVDATNGDQNAYGLTIAPVTAGLITAGDLIVTNFNNGNPFNIQGLGTTMEVL